MTDQECNRAPLAKSCSGAVSVRRGVELSTHDVQTISGPRFVLAQAKNFKLVGARIKNAWKSEDNSSLLIFILS